MNLIYKTWRRDSQQEDSVENYVEGCLTHTDYDTRGAAECANERANNCARAIGQLVEILADKGLLNKGDIDSICRNTDSIIELKKK